MPSPKATTEAASRAATAVAEEIGTAVDGAMQGDFTHRIALDGGGCRRGLRARTDGAGQCGAAGRHGNLEGR